MKKLKWGSPRRYSLLPKERPNWEGSQLPNGETQLGREESSYTEAFHAEAQPGSKGSLSWKADCLGIQKLSGEKRQGSSSIEGDNSTLGSTEEACPHRVLSCNKHRHLSLTPLSSSPPPL